MSIIEIIAVIFSLTCVMLTTKQNIWCWFTGMIGVTAYFILFLQNQLYAEMGLQVVFFGQSIYGWHNWKKGEGEYITNKLPVSKLKNSKKTYSALFLATLTCFVLIDKYTDASLPILDSSTAMMSLWANWMLTKKKIESWYLWILVDVLLIGLFLYKGLYLSSGLYFIFLILAINGLLKWKKDLEMV